MTRQKHSFPTVRDGPETQRVFSSYTEEKQVAKPPKREEKKVAKKPVLKQALDITAVVVNYKTKHLISKAVKTFREHYPNIPLVLIDNNSQDGSTDWCARQRDEHTTVLISQHNIGHGPALHQGIQRAKTKFVFTFDSDVVFNRGGFLEEMQSAICGKYAVGWLRWVGANGVASRNKNTAVLCPYIHPYAALYDKAIYEQLKPFNHKGAPCVDNMQEAKRRGIVVASFPIESYVTHLVAGTRRLYGGHWDGNGKEPIKWNPEARIPI